MFNRLILSVVLVLLMPSVRVFVIRYTKIIVKLLKFSFTLVSVDLIVNLLHKSYDCKPKKSSLNLITYENFKILITLEKFRKLLRLRRINLRKV